MKYGKNDIEWHISVQGMSLTDFCNVIIWGKKKEALIFMQVF